MNIRLRGVEWLLLALFLGLTGWTIWGRPLEQAVAFAATDDGLYYPKLAENIVRRGGCTYDGITQTNGFHPLWLLLLTPLHALFADPFAALRADFFLILAVLLAALGIWLALARRQGWTATGTALGGLLLFLNLRSLTIFFSLLESHLVLLGYLAYAFMAVRSGAARFERPRAAFRHGLVIGLCFLARLDGFLLAAAYALAWGARRHMHPGRMRREWRSAAAAAAGCLLLTIPYLAWNVVTFGRLQTVSAWRKAMPISLVASWRIVWGWTWNQFLPRVGHVLGLEKVPVAVWLAAGVTAALTLAIWLFTGARRRRLTAAGGPLELHLFALLHAVFIFLVAPLDMAASAWYWVPELTAAALLVAAAAPEWRWGAWRPAPALAALAVFAQGALYPRWVARKTMTTAKLEAAAWLRENTPPDARGAMFDSGIVSYFSRRDFVGLNGLIGDFELAAALRDGRRAEAARRCGVEWLVLDTPEALLPAWADDIAFITPTKTRFENFAEPPKPFVVYRVTPESLDEIWRRRYGLDGR